MKRLLTFLIHKYKVVKFVLKDVTEAFQLFEVQNTSDKDCTTTDIPSCTSTSLDDIHMTIHYCITDNIKMETIMLYNNC